MTVISHASRDVCELYIRLSASSDWSGNWLLADQVIRAGDSIGWQTEPGSYSLSLVDCWGQPITGDDGQLIEVVWADEPPPTALDTGTAPSDLSSDEQLRSMQLNNEGMELLRAGQYDEALLKFEAALEIATEIDDQAGEGANLYNIGDVYYYQGRYAAALDSYT
jgi:tetratricopeptide (TPR) repeat protein